MLIMFNSRLLCMTTDAFNVAFEVANAPIAINTRARSSASPAADFVQLRTHCGLVLNTIHAAPINIAAGLSVLPQHYSLL